MSAPKVYKVIARDLCVGTVHFTRWSGKGEGWQFIAHFQRQPSRKLWPTPEAAIGRAVPGYTLHEQWPAEQCSAIAAIAKVRP